MLRTFLYTAIALVVFAGAGLAADEAKKKKQGKKKAGNVGQIVKVDAEKGTLTVKMAGKKKQPGAEKEFKLTDKTTVTATVTAEKVADLLKIEPFKAGANVQIETEEDGTTVKAIRVGGAAAEGKKKKKKTDA